MRFIITLITSLILLLPTSGQGEWERVDLGIDSVKIGFTNGDTIWVQLDHIQDVQFIDRDIGFISAGRGGFHISPWGILFKTIDGGKTWNHIYYVHNGVAYSGCNTSKTCN